MMNLFVGFGNGAISPHAQGFFPEAEPMAFSLLCWVLVGN
jgi:hypothetical protein